MQANTARNPQLFVTEAALARVAKILANDGVHDALRISVEGGGCSGFSYKYDLVSGGREPDDLVFEGGGGRVIVDALSLQYMAGSKIDFVDDLMGQSFKIINPNAVASCGCGTSFSV
jgi:iron-sulfur cluster assembly accessory protein